MNRKDKNNSNYRHGLTNTPEHSVWSDMKRRCYDPRRADFKFYGGLGIIVCKRWMKFESFISDMGPRPSNHHTLERIDVNGNYAPSNCKWATRKEQANNTKRNVKLTLDDKTMTISQWAEHLGISQWRIRSRLKAGWNNKKTLTTPKKVNQFG